MADFWQPSAFSRWFSVAVPLGLLLAAIVPGPDADLLGPLRRDAYLAAYLVLLLPNAFVATAFMFSLATLNRRAIVSYLGGVLLFAACVFSRTFVAGTLGRWKLATLLDPLGLTALSELSMTWTPAEKSTLLDWPPGFARLEPPSVDRNRLGVCSR